VRVVKSIILVLGLAWCLPSPAADRGKLDDLPGTWLVEPLSSPGIAVVDVVTFSKANDGLSGVWRTWTNREEQDTALDQIELHNHALSLRVHTPKWRLTWKGEFNRQDRMTLQLILSGGTPLQARVFRRVADDELAKLIADTPNDLLTKKLPLPPLQPLPSNGLAQTPVMGWNSWNHFKEAVDDAVIRRAADALVSSGLRDAGYVYVDIDDGWQGRRDAHGVLQPNSKFPDMKALADYVHSKGLKFGIYNSPGPLSCAQYVGSHGHESEDAQAFARWGVDLLKYDWCSAATIYKTQPEMQALYQKMGAALQASGRPIVYSLCQYGLFDVGRWGRQVGGNLWRTGQDTVIGARWDAMSARFEADGKPQDNGPGGWNDPDMMLMGNGGMTTEEYRTHMTLWSMLAAPLILGNDLTALTPEIKRMLMNKEVIAIDQDALGKQGRRVKKRGTTEVWTKPLADGAAAVALFNRGTSAADIVVKWSDVELVGAQQARNLWEQSDLGRLPASYKVTVAPHGSVLLKVAAVKDPK